MNVSDLISDLFGAGNPKRMPEHLFLGAQRLDYKTAQRADISNQNYMVCPRHWYADGSVRWTKLSNTYLSHTWGTAGYSGRRVACRYRGDLGNFETSRSALAARS